MMERIILHIDMDAFYASVERLDDPSLNGRPVIVGGTSNRGVVSAASYEARRFGVHSAMPISKAKKKCPHGIFLPVRMERYRDISHKVMNILDEFTPLIEQVSIDEAFMDMSGTEKLSGPVEEIGLKIKGRIAEFTSLTCSIGIAPNKFLAKVASDMNKPDGLTIISPENVPGFIKKLPIKKVPGVGGKTMRSLQGIGVTELGDMKRVSDQVLNKLGKFGKRLLKLSQGTDESKVIPFTESKSISSEDTLPVDTNDMAVLHKQLLIQSENVGRRLREKGLKGSTLILKLKQADFKKISKSLTLHKGTQSSNLIYEQCLMLLKDFDANMKFRLIGIGVSNLARVNQIPEQLNLFEHKSSKEKAWGNVEKVMDKIRERHGADAIKRGGLIKEPLINLTRTF